MWITLICYGCPVFFLRILFQVMHNIKIQPSTYFIVSLILMICLSCYHEGGIISARHPFAPDSVTSVNVSYENFVKPLLMKNCATCHGSGGSAQSWWVNTDTYENAATHSKSIVATITNNTMPPPPKFPFTDRDKELLNAWLNKGTPK
jgi:uncharacterized membrane protein